ncbi:hypothetical protein K402DRAFT_425684 [Aulographum hederae CBS 113979]|uniref:Uncharacterized protein n=1 Tax=Aulographum hederae CBS 113979 TaxID=1176131 RepID=A0A6G1GJH3_9PEZI|nr:hypothetical protein K402DRAFT_425684 [Aulographum hederae CBS 113979]
MANRQNKIDQYIRGDPARTSWAVQGGALFRIKDHSKIYRSLAADDDEAMEELAERARSLQIEREREVQETRRTNTRASFLTTLTPDSAQEVRDACDVVAETASILDKRYGEIDQKRIEAEEQLDEEKRKPQAKAASPKPASHGISDIDRGEMEKKDEQARQKLSNDFKIRIGRLREESKSAVEEAENVGKEKIASLEKRVTALQDQLAKLPTGAYVPKSQLTQMTDLNTAFAQLGATLGEKNTQIRKLQSGPRAADERTPTVLPADKGLEMSGTLQEEIEKLQKALTKALDESENYRVTVKAELARKDTTAQERNANLTEEIELLKHNIFQAHLGWDQTNKALELLLKQAEQEHGQAQQ